MAWAIGRMCILDSSKEIDGSFGRCRGDPDTYNHYIKRISTKKTSEANDYGTVYERTRLKFQWKAAGTG